jgi:hypothetical protein
MLALISVGLLYLGFVVNAIGEFRMNVTARRIGLGLAVPATLFGVFLLVEQLALGGLDIVFLVGVTMTTGFVLSIIGESKENRKLRISGLLLQVPMIVLGFFIVVLMLAFSHL